MSKRQLERFPDFKEDLQLIQEDTFTPENQALLNDINTFLETSRSVDKDVYFMKNEELDGAYFSFLHTPVLAAPENVDAEPSVASKISATE